MEYMDKHLSSFFEPLIRTYIAQNELWKEYYYILSATLANIVEKFAPQERDMASIAAASFIGNVWYCILISPNS